MKLSSYILQEELKLTVNDKKTHITSVFEGVSFLGYIIKRNVSVKKLTHR